SATGCRRPPRWEQAHGDAGRVLPSAVSPRMEDRAGAAVSSGGASPHIRATLPLELRRENTAPLVLATAAIAWTGPDGGRHARAVVRRVGIKRAHGQCG